MNTLFMLDTDICSYIIKANPLSVTQRFERMPSGAICISAITRAELLYGIIKTPSKKIGEKLEAFLRILRIIDFDASAAEHYAKIKATLENKGTPIGNMDMLIAACALACGATLVTNNQKHFSQIRGLKTENWV